LNLPEAAGLVTVRSVSPTPPPPDAPPVPEPYAIQQGELSLPQIVSRADFNETLYFLDRSELELLSREFEREQRRDLRGDVLNALFDRLEEPLPERQAEIIRILRQLLPTYLGAGELKYVTRILSELSRAPEERWPKASGARRRRSIGLGEPAVLSQLLSPSSRQLRSGRDELGASGAPGRAPCRCCCAASRPGTRRR
jgi:hypothetical protein